MTDRSERQLAVDPARSVIVQAPAGSGKTTLLVERYLGLLGVVEAPEEILAMTFTRKAAAEMRQRILQLLDPDFVPQAPHERAAHDKARAVAERVREWRLRENPQRLLIRTIDSFSHYLARRMPVASQLGPVPAPGEDTRALYREAVRRVLALLDSGEAIAGDLETLLLWRDHRGQDIENLLVAMLGRREQWLRALGVTGAPDREQLEGIIFEVVHERLAEAVDAFCAALESAGFARDDLLTITAQAAASLRAEDIDKPLLAWSGRQALPGTHPDDLPSWRGLFDLVLTQKGRWRAAPNKNDGFPPDSEHKQRIVALLDAVRPDADLAALLHRARHLPEPHYGDDEWRALAALIRVLERSAGELELVFAETGRSDFAGLAAAALRGLGDEDAGYTDLALYLDRRIRHVLVDEYQDTNWSQYHLLERLVGGWQPGEARSLFVVGDPMQSIYRFREAEVGLFMRSREHGIGAQALESRRLTQNFRSCSEIVDWVNDRLGPIFPENENVSAGAVSYAASEPGRGSGGGVDLLARPDRASEAEAVVDTVEKALETHRDEPDFSAAIIVRARTHLADILPVLQRRGIGYRAVKLDPLLDRPVVQDLLAITRAVLNPADTAAVLAILRSPVCGLTLEALHRLAGDGRSLHAADALKRLDAADCERAGRVFAALDDARERWRRRPLHSLVEGVWRRLGGPDVLARPETDARDAQRFLDSLDQAADEDLVDDPNALMELLAGQQTEGDPPDDDIKLEILTMHGAKGLEWDQVILPGLDRGTRRQDRELLYWLPLTPETGDEQMLLAPLRSAEHAESNRLVNMIRDEEAAREAFEHQRLLYVAATRARQRLVLSARLDPEKDDTRPAADSLLADLWPTCADDFLAALEAAPETGETGDDDARPDQTLQRVPDGWRPPIDAAFPWRPALPPRERFGEIEFNWAGIRARRIGIVLHRLFEQIGRIGIERLTDNRRRQLIERIPALLQARGAGPASRETDADVVRTALEQTLDSDTGRWILGGEHRDAACELPVTGVIDGELVNAVIDRTFIDENGTRWIIDYKSGYHAGGDLEGFLAEEAGRYQVQLSTYRRLFELMGETDIRAALYLPRHGELRIVGEN